MATGRTRERELGELLKAFQEHARFRRDVNQHGVRRQELADLSSASSPHGVEAPLLHLEKLGVTIAICHLPISECSTLERKKMCHQKKGVQESESLIELFNSYLSDFLAPH